MIDLDKNDILCVFGFDGHQLAKLDATELMSLTKEIRQKYRPKKEFEKARQEYKALLQYFHNIIGKDDRISNKNIASVEYEAGYTAFLDGDYADAIKLLKQSAKSSELCQDEVGVEIGNYMSAHMQFLAGEIDITVARKAALHAFERFSFIYKTTNSDFALNWITNAQNRLFDLAIRANDKAEAKLRYDHIIESMRIGKEFGKNNSVEDQGSGRLKIKLSLGALLCFVSQDYEGALKNYAQFLDLDLSQWGKIDARINPEFINSIGLARDYYYAGKSLLLLGHTEKAKEVFDAGLALTSKDGNHSFHEQIRDELKNIVTFNAKDKEFIP